MVTEGWTGRVVSGVETAIRKSFATDALIRPVVTQDEIKRRFKICLDGFRMMRRDLGWAVPRIVDTLPAYLRAELDEPGGWTPPPEHRSSWFEEGKSRPAELDGPDLAPEVPDGEGIETEGLG